MAGFLSSLLNIVMIKDYDEQPSLNLEIMQRMASLIIRRNIGVPGCNSLYPLYLVQNDQKTPMKDGEKRG